MPSQTTLGGFFNEEWERFVKGVRLLHPDIAEAELRKEKSLALTPGAPRTITIPGWDDVFHVRPRYQPTEAERTEYWNARRERRPPQLQGAVTQELDRRRHQANAARTSAAPGWNKGWSAILTAIDNVQDFASTVATFGRLLVWGFPVLGAPLARIPNAADAARRAFLDYLASPAARALIAGGRADLASRLADQAGRRAASAVVAGRGVSLAARLGVRLIPGLGTAILISDILNTISLLGMMANVLYAGLCAGPKEALAAGVPMALFKRALQGEAWRWLRSNPFGHSARLRRKAKALGQLPSISNLWEVGQTTDQLFGVGVSFGGLVSMLVESANSAALIAEGASVRINAQPLARSFGLTINEPLARRSPAELLLTRRAAIVAATIPQLFLRIDDFNDDDVLLFLTAYAVAVDTVARQLRGHPWQDTFAAASVGHFVPPIDLDPITEDALVAAGIALPGDPGWAVDDTPPSLTGEEYTQRVGLPAGQALRKWLLARRTTETGVYVGALVTAITEVWTTALEDDTELAAWSLTADSKVIHSLAEEGLIPTLGAPETALARFWEAARETIDDTGGRTLGSTQLRRLAALHGVELIPALAPDSPLPAAWGVAAG